LLTKSDLNEVLGDFDPERAVHFLRNLANSAPAITLSSRSGNGMDKWVAWLRQQMS
jgi:hydrogenase nickel incorporation protein HypB